MSTVVVANNNDSGAGSLRNAVANAVAGDTVDLTHLSGTITFASGIEITRDVTITGPGVNVLTLDGNNAFQMFNVDGGMSLTISGLKFINGSSGNGGAIFNVGTLAVSNSWFSGNHVTSGGGGFGGAISSWSGSSFSISGCTFDNNSVVSTGGNGLGGAVSGVGSGGSITNSTFTQNFARGGDTGYGGAVFLSSAGTTITNCTIIGNSAESGGGTVGNGNGGGLYSEGATTTVTNSIIAQNFGGGVDVSSGGQIFSGGHNLIGNFTGSIFVNGVNGDQVGSSGSPLNPHVGAEADNGGPTPTIALLSNSTAIDAGTSTGAPTLDQRGDARQGAVDIGAYEYQVLSVSTAAAALPTTVTGTTTALTVLGADVGGENNVTYTWAATTEPAGAAVMFSSNGTNTAKLSTATFNMAGTYVLTATLADGGISITSAVTVTVSQTLTSVVVSPLSLSLIANGTHQFAAVAFDQFGNALSSQPAFTWSKTAGIGSVNSTGLYSAGPAAGSATIQAGSAGVNGTAGVTVTYTPPAFSSTAVTGLSPSKAYSYSITTTNPDGGPLTITAMTKPAWLTIADHGDGTAALTGTPTGADNGSNPVVLTVSDGTTSVNQSFSIVVDLLPTVSVSDVTVAKGLSNTSNATFTATLSAASTAPVTVDYATTPGTAKAGVDFAASSGTVVVPAGQTSATFTVGVFGNVASASGSFTVSLSNPVGATLSTTNSVGTATITGINSHIVNFGGKIKAVYTDAAGQQVTVALAGPGIGVLVFPAGTGNVDADSVILAGTTVDSRLTITTSHNATTNIAFIRSTSPMGNIIAGSTNLTGDLSLNTVRNLILRSVNGATKPGGSAVTLAAGAVNNLTLGTVTDASITSGSIIRNLTVDSWTDNGANDTISAPAIKTIVSAGDFAPSVTAGSMTTLSIKGAVTGGAWNFDGTVQSLTTGGITSDWTAHFTGNVGAFTVKGDLDGSLTAQSVQSLTVTGSVNGSTINLTGSNGQLGKLAALGLLAVRGNVSNSTITSVANMGTISVGGMSGSEIFAGILLGTTGLPTSNDFAVASSIRSVNVKGLPFADSNIAARAIGSVTLADVTTDNAGTPFGVATKSLKAFALRRPGQKALLWHNNQSTAVFNTLPGDLRIQLI
ncbi:MAG: polymorphic outer membrane protein [Phycisphaerales bacterium]|nr:polymorphic outer membrane protein [Phycisphaerales bacterium]